MCTGADKERVVIAAGERRRAVLALIQAARLELALSLFRCDDFPVLDELAAARRRGVRIRALITAQAKGWRQRLEELGAVLESMGAQVRRYWGPYPKYHAKYMLADDGPALVGSLNFTRRCFRNTCDFVALTHDAEVAAGLKRLFEADWRAPEGPPPEDLTERLIVGPEQARRRLASLLEGARQSIRIIDHKLDDAEMLGLLEAKRVEGVAVQVLGEGDLGRLAAHGRLILVDRRVAVIGSIALTAASLDRRREVALVMTAPGCVEPLSSFFEELTHAPAG